MQEAISRRREKLFNVGVVMQPMVVLVGDLNCVQCAYVVLDDTTWKLQSALKAVDICFKAYHVLHAAYPAESHAWYLIQKLVFGISTVWDVKSTAVSSITTELSK
jgi:hypothetical protein